MGTHDGHRSRMRSRFIENGLNSFEDHEVLELLLFYGQPRKNTNETAHALLNRFGSLHQVFNASIADLQEVEGVGESCAVLLNLIPQLQRKYEMSKSVDTKTIKGTSDAGPFFVAQFRNEQDEVLKILCLDAKGSIKKCVDIGKGVVNSVHFSPRKIVETALENKASSVIMAHNHPGGTIMPSREDINATMKVKNALDTVDIRLNDHIIVADKDYCSLLEEGYFNTI